MRGVCPGHRYHFRAEFKVNRLLKPHWLTLLPNHRFMDCQPSAPNSGPIFRTPHSAFRISLFSAYRAACCGEGLGAAGLRCSSKNFSIAA